MIGKADGQHLTQAAFVRSGKIGVRLDTIDGHDDVGIKRGTIKRNRNARSGCANQAYIFSGDDRRSGRFFRDAQVSQHLLLPCGCAAAVTAHGRHDEGRQTSLQARSHRRPHDRHDVTDAATADADGDAAPGSGAEFGQPVADHLTRRRLRIVEARTWE